MNDVFNYYWHGIARMYSQGFYFDNCENMLNYFNLKQKITRKLYNNVLKSIVIIQNKFKKKYYTKQLQKNTNLSTDIIGIINGFI